MIPSHRQGAKLPASRKIAAYRHGLRQEMLAAWMLRLKGFRILARRCRTPYGEIDLIARRGGLLVFAEIKARASEADAYEAIGRRQQRRIIEAAQHYLQMRGWPEERYLLRFDAIACRRGHWPKHLTDAWRGD